LSELDHARRDVDHDHLAAELVPDPRGELARSSPDLEHAFWIALSHCLEREIPWIRALGSRVERATRLEIRLCRVLARDS
jgi:hypothetical protein